jgi:hypothetical protein
MAETEYALDLLSISQTNLPKCVYGAPIVALVLTGKATIGQACCNHWDCPRCGMVRAKQEYRRIVNGCEVLAMGHKLYFWTITCRGKDCSLEEAEGNYYAWTNTLLTNARAKCKREMGYWAYAQVTERQKKTRSHPHSHIITTFLPDDATLSHNQAGRHTIISEWFTRANYTAGLGSQHKISEVENASAVSRYVAKYMFKESMNEKWPAKWKRVRYSQSWPKLTELKSDFLVVLRTQEDWKHAERQRQNFVCETHAIYDLARHHIGNILPPSYIDTM